MTTRRAPLAKAAAIFLVMLFLGVGLLTAPPAVEASAIVSLSLDELSQNADRVVYARTLDTTSRLAAGGQPGANKGDIETVVRLEVLNVAKGQAGKELTIVLPGGTLGGLTLYVDSVPLFTPGQTDLVFLDSQGRVVGGPQGKMAVVGNVVVPLKKSVSEVLGQVAGSAGGLEITRTIAAKSPVAFAQSAGPPQSGQITLDATALTDGFEAGFGQWTLLGSPTWGLTTYRADAGSWSAYCAESSISAPGPYVNYMDAWMIAGPFDLSAVTTATLEYDLFLDTEADYDFCNAMVSTNGTDFNGTGFSGSTGGLWAAKTLDLSLVAGGPYIGDSSVWVAFQFVSDYSYTYEGAYVDNVQLITSNDPPPAAPAITGITPSSGSAGTGTQVTISGTNFGATRGSGRVEFYYQSTTRMTAPTIVSWSDTAIVCVVPTASMSGYPGSAGTGPVTVVTSSGTSNGYNFNVTFGYGGIKWPSPSCSYKLNANTADTTSEEALFDAGAAAWNPPSSFKFVDAGPCTATSPSLNGQNEVYWTNSLPTGVLAQNSYWWNSSAPTIIIENDIGFNDYYTWGTGSTGTYDIQSIASHELGHSLNLRDLYGPGDSTKVMYGYGGSGEQKRTLHADDAAGIQWIYGGGVPTLTITAPVGSGSYAAGDSLGVNWTSNQTLSTGEFSVWVRSGSGGWYIGQLVAASGGTSFSTSLTLSVPAGTGYQAIVAYRATAGSGTWGSFATSPGSFAVTSGAPTLTITAPVGSGSYAAGDSLGVNWTSNQTLSTGEFSVWVRSGSGGWYIGQLVAASGGTSFSTSLTLSVPAGTGYQAIVAYRATAGSGTWGSFATSPGSFAVTSGAPTLTITAPVGSGSYAAGDSLGVNWTSNQTLSTGEFSVWVRSGSGGWYIGQLVAASGGTSFSTSLTLSVPAGTGYQAIVAYRATAGSGTWGSFATSPGSFAVTSGAPTLTITAPVGSGSYAAGDSLGVNWTSNQTLSTGEFSVWVRSGSGGWYIGQLVAASGGTSFSTSLTLSVPAGTGYQAIVAYRATAGSGTWGSLATSPGSFAVTSGAPTLTITAPVGSGSYAAGDSLGVNWTSNQTLSTGEFSVWVRSGSGGWYIGQLVAASGGTSFSTSLTLSVPAGTGYQAIVAYRATAGSGSWGSWATSPGSFTVTSGG